MRLQPSFVFSRSVLQPQHQQCGLAVSKTRPIRVLHMRQVVSGGTPLEKLLLKTLEGNEPIDATTVFCVGEGGDVWQQRTTTLLSKYDCTDIDPATGWFVFTPKPGNRAWATELTESVLTALLESSGAPATVDVQSLAIESNHGHLLDDGRQVHFLKLGDYLVSAHPDATDFWIVDRGFFQSTYTTCAVA